MWIQDAAGPHKAKDTLNFLRQHCGDKVIAQFFNSESYPSWAPYSCDLNVCDTYLWNAIQEGLDKGKYPTTVEEMKMRIKEIANDLPQEHINNAIMNFFKRAKKCLEQDGGSFERLM